MTEFIAEIGGNHQGDENRIIQLTEDAINSGIKILKYQIQVEIQPQPIIT